MMLLQLDSISEEGVMVRSETRIVIAVVAVLIALAAIAASIRGLIFDEPQMFRYGIAALIAGVASFVMLLNPTRDGDA
jgi:hypothetical protein